MALRMRNTISALVIPLFCLTFLLLGLVINLVQAILLMLIPKTLFRKVNYYLVYGIHGYLLAVGDWWANNKVNIYCSKELQMRIMKREVKEHAIFLMNHHTELDWLYSWVLGDRMGVLGNCKAFTKSVLKFVPIIGWSWAMSDMVFLSRGDWDKDQKTIGEKLRILADYPSPVWLLLFPEGTRFTKQKHQASQEFAIMCGLPLMDHHLTPRTKGFSFIVEVVDREKFEAIYDITLVEGEGSAPFNISSLMGGRSCTGNVYIRRVPLNTIPINKEEAAAWLHNFYNEKDSIKKSFLSTGNFNNDCSLVQPPRHINGLVLLVVPNMLVLAWLINTLVSGSWMMRLTVVLLGGVAIIAMKIIGDTTKIDKSSKYGENNNKSLVKTE